MKEEQLLTDESYFIRLMPTGKWLVRDNANHSVYFVDKLNDAFDKIQDLKKEEE